MSRKKIDGWTLNSFNRFLRNRFVADCKLHDIGVSDAMACLMKRKGVLEQLFGIWVYEDSEHGKARVNVKTAPKS